MQRSFATLALLGYLLGGMLLPATHRHGAHEHDHHQEAADGSATTCGHHQDVSCCPTEGFAGDPSGVFIGAATPQTHECDGACLLCQLSSQVYVAKSLQRGPLQAARTASWKPPRRQLPPTSQRRTSGYLRGPPTFIS